MFSRLASLLQLVVLLGTATASPTHDTPAVVRPITVSISTSSDLSSSPSSLSAASLSSTAASTSSPSTPLATAALDKAQVIGIVNGSVTTFNGIPFAEPPVGDLRLRFPVPIHGYNGTIDATQPATQCIQLEPQIRVDMPPQMLQDVVAYSASVLPTSSAPQSEDCLNINVQIPTGTKPGEKLPVVAYIFGGGFVVGSNAQISGDALVARSVEMGQPVIFAAMNYRLHAFGFLGGKEVKDAGVGNLGLHDQHGRRACKLVGVAGQEGRAGSRVIRIEVEERLEERSRGDVREEKLVHVVTELLLSPVYIISDRFEGAWVLKTYVMLKLPVAKIVPSSSASPEMNGMSATWLASTKCSGGAIGWSSSMYPVGIVEPALMTDPRKRPSVLPPFVTIWSAEEIAPEDGPQRVTFSGSPPKAAIFFWIQRRAWPMYKRMAAFQGDMIFQAPRRFILDQRSSKQPTWSYISERGAVPGLGFAHGTDIASAISGQELADYIIQFTATQDPNGKNGTASEHTIYWPKYDTAKRQVLSVLNDSLAIGNDTLRLEPIASLTALSLAFPL
ncbi:alpha/beta-hydrolase [Dichomitus squalens LYAD-421 SS1]|uniref:Alpha/beta-hydrolase n=1 Tax=Dichomitus squalens (strain LYAD-421) TaxID=732165 RepID=R7SWQ6_DICSQ|nr:alpha/beta-hydrolase [Dichomitus squalens LYAD-421 SS1]EJF60604.1 alpha/beta-hydrolase [Dichomitus squalens LYAD-421 SS1]